MDELKWGNVETLVQGRLKCAKGVTTILVRKIRKLGEQIVKVKIIALNWLNSQINVLMFVFKSDFNSNIFRG